MAVAAGAADDNTATSQTASKSLNCSKTMARGRPLLEYGGEPSLSLSLTLAAHRAGEGPPLQHIGVIKV